MVAILVPGQAGAVDDINVSQGGFREQIGAIALAVKRFSGAGDFGVGTTVLYVNPEIGRDTYRTGNAAGTPVVSNQQLTCGYSETSPFKTIQRAIIEAYRLSITPGPTNDFYDRVLIRVLPGEHIIANGPGSATPTAWTDGFEPTLAQLQQLNPVSNGGVILPRGVSIIGADLRKTVIRPQAVPGAGGNPSTDRRTIFKCTGGSFFFNFTFKDANGIAASHHLLSAFAFCPTSDLTAAYDRWDAALAKPPADSEVMPGETEIVAPYPDGQAQPSVDTTVGASSYVFNCSLRSDYGMCGIYLDGSLVTGFKSMVVAQFTNVSLQRDMQAWEIFSGGNWVVPADYNAYIAADINNTRSRVGGNYNHVTGCYDTDYRSFAFKAINGAILQEVSCFVIGDAVHHWTASGGELTITNSNSNFGMTALESSGFRGIGTAGGAFPQDSGWQMDALRRALQIRQDGSNIRQITIGTVGAYDPATGQLTLSDPLTEDLLRGYTLKQGDFLWIENRRQDTGPGAPNAAIDVRAEIASAAWDGSTGIALNPSTSLNVNNITTVDPAILLGNRVYIRRLVDTRTPEQRTYSLIVQNSNAARSRRPPGNFIVRLGNRTGVADQLDPTNSTDQVYLISDVTATGSATTAQGERRFRISLRAGDSAKAFQAGSYYRFGTPVLQQNRIYKSRRTKQMLSFNAEEWEPALSMLPSARGVEFPRSQVGTAVIIDADLSNNPDSNTLGINLATNPDVRRQLTSTTDYQAIAGFMEAVGYQAGDIASVLTPQATEEAREWDPSAPASPAPAGKLSARAPWPVEFNRPSLIRAFGHAYEWAGQSNYSKAMPKYQVTALSDQHKVDFFAVNHLGGRVYNTGFNEDGLLVQGDTIRDLGTGRELNTDIAGLGGLSGDPDIPITVIPNSFENLTVTNTFQSLGSAEINNVTLNGLIDGSPTWAPGALPIATEITEGTLRFATTQETADLSVTNAALTPGGLGLLANQPNGWGKLDAGGKIPASLLPDVTGSVLSATTTRKGIVELATNTEGLALADAELAVTPAVLGYIRARANGLASLDANNLLPQAQLPDIPVTKLPKASTTQEGILRFSNAAEVSSYSGTAALTPTDLGSLLNQANGLLQLSAGNAIPTVYLDVATDIRAGIVELAVDPIVDALTDAGRAMVPAYLNALLGANNGIATLDATGLLPLARVPKLPTTRLKLTPVPWVNAADNLAQSNNFTFSHSGTGNTLALGAVTNIANYLGLSGFIRVANGTGVALTGINDPMWRPVFNTWIDPQAQSSGLSGDLLIGFYIASTTEVAYDVTRLA